MTEEGAAGGTSAQRVSAGMAMSYATAPTMREMGMDRETMQRMHCLGGSRGFEVDGEGRWMDGWMDVEQRQG